jgi:hypothetical protein
MSGAANVLRLLPFLAFLILGLSVRQSQSRAALRLIVFFLAITTVVGLTQREAWPFTTWALVHHMAPAEFGGIAVELVDATGAVHRGDSRMWQPIAQEEAEAWLSKRFRSMTDEERATFSGQLLDRAERVRWRLASGSRSSNERFLGPLAAPYHFQRRPVWTADTPPFVGIRFTEVRWDVEKRARDDAAVESKVLYEYRPR